MTVVSPVSGRGDKNSQLLAFVLLSSRFMQEGGSFISLAKGNRSKAVTTACKKYGGFYLGSIGGPAAILAKNCIRKVEVLDNEEDGTFQATELAG